MSNTNRRGTEAQVGLALVVALLVLVFGLMWFQKYSLGADYSRVRVIFPKVGGLGAGDPVMVRGLDMGKVTSVDLTGDGVLVSLRLPGEITLREDAVLTLGSAGIMGERMVAVEPGVGAAIDVANHVFDGEYEAATTELVGTVEVLNTAVLSFLARTEELIASLQDDEILVRTLENTAETTKIAGEVLTENRKELARATKSMAALTERMGSFLDENGDDLSKGIDGLVRATDTMDTLAIKLNGVLDGTDELLTALREQKGAAGKMIYDEQAGEDLVESLKQLRFLVEDLQRNPQRYLTVKIF